MKKSLRVMRESSSRFGWLVPTIAVLFSLPAGVSALAQQTPSLTEVRVAVTAPTVGAPEFRAGIKRGLFEKHGLRLILTQLPSGTENIAATAGGSADIAFADLFAGLNAVANGFDIRLIAPNHTTAFDVHYLVPKDSPIKTPSDFKGKSVALGAVPFYTVFARAFFESNGIDANDVKLTLIRQPTALGEALASGQVDAIQSVGVSKYHWIARYGLRTVGNTDTSTYQNPRATLAAWWATSRWAEANVETARKFTAALRETYAWWEGLTPAERGRYLKEITNIDAFAIEEELPGTLVAITRSNVISGPIDIEATQSWVEVGKRHGGVPKNVNFEPRVFQTAR